MFYNPTTMDIFRVLFIGFGLGIKHAVEADHVAAVSTFSARTHSFKKAILTGVVWGLGHSLILLFAGVFVLVLKINIPEHISLLLEFGVGIMLVYLGIRTLRIKDEIHSHPHDHENTKHAHKHFHTREPRGYRASFIVGSIHGLAGSGSFMLVFLSDIQDLFTGFAYILIFGLGSIGAMAIMSFIISIPVIITSQAHNRIEYYIRIISGAISTMLGGYIIYQIGFVEGLFIL